MGMSILSTASSISSQTDCGYQGGSCCRCDSSFSCVNWRETAETWQTAKYVRNCSSVTGWSGGFELSSCDVVAETFGSWAMRTLGCATTRMNMQASHFAQFIIVRLCGL